MKSYFLCALTCLMLSTTSKAQWTWLNPTPAGNINLKVVFTDSKNGFILNNNGDLLVTTDQGGQWKFKQNFSYAIDMAYRDSLMVISGYNIVYTSRDKGITWNSQKSPELAILENISILNRDTFFVSTQTGHLYKTTNGGISWIYSNIGEQVFTVKFTDSKTGYAGGNLGRVIKTTNGGSTWFAIKQNGLSNNFMELHFIDSTNGWAYRQYYNMFHTKDGGKSWDSTGISDVKSIFFVDQNIGYCAGEGGVVLKTIDGGKTWTGKTIDGGIFRDLYSICFLSADTGFAVGAMGRILKTTDGGVNWTQYSPTYMDFLSVHFPALNIGYAPTKDSIYKTIDNGLTWKALNSIKAESPNRSYPQFGLGHFFNADTGFIFETEPLRICRTNDGGKTWSITAPFFYMIEDVISLNFYNDSSAYAVFTGLQGTTSMRTIDRGNTWKEVAITNSLKKTFFLDDKIGFGLYYQHIAKTTDSGKTWTPYFINTEDALNSIWFTDRATGYVAGQHGYLAQSIDSGKTWNTIRLNDFIDSHNEIFSVKFFNKRIGYAIMANGVVLKTIAGGKTWTNEKVMPMPDLKDITFGKDSTVYVAGTYGSILKNNIAGYQVDSLKSVSDASCRITLSALLSSTMKPVDSIFFEYGVGNFNNSIKAGPSTSIDSSVWISAVLNNLSKDSLYSLRMKIYFDKQVYYYSENTYFRPTGPARPVITAQDKILTSSADQGNQWYLNGVVIAGATGKQYTATVTGQYRVSTSVNNCNSDLSSAYNLIITATNDIFFLNNGLKVFPNPVQKQLFIRSNNYRQLKLRLMDVYGHVVLEKNLTGTSNTVQVSTLSSGIYMLYIIDPANKESGCLKLIKE